MTRTDRLGGEWRQVGNRDGEIARSREKLELLTLLTCQAVDWNSRTEHQSSARDRSTAKETASRYRSEDIVESCVLAHLVTSYDIDPNLRDCSSCVAGLCFILWFPPCSSLPLPWCFDKQEASPPFGHGRFACNRACAVAGQYRHVPTKSWESYGISVGFVWEAEYGKNAGRIGI